MMIDCVVVEAYQNAYYWVAEKTGICLPFPFSWLYRKSYVYLSKRDKLHKDYWTQYCDVCGKELQGAGESFSLHTEVWKEVYPDGNGESCIACFEVRLGRKLNTTDFFDYWELPTDSAILKNRASKPTVDKTP